MRGLDRLFRSKIIPPLTNAEDLDESDKYIHMEKMPIKYSMMSTRSICLIYLSIQECTGTKYLSNSAHDARRALNAP